ncbi:voltage-gated potassium channel [Aureococcus anophagefferens]|nr:voltage-gated potassium channel [Aureococcus anophagefferens]
MGGHPRRPRWAAGSAVALGGLACVVAASFRSLLIDPRSAVRSAADRWIRFAAPPGKTLASTVALDASAFLAFPAVVEMLDLKVAAAHLYDYVPRQLTVTPLAPRSARSASALGGWVALSLSSGNKASYVVVVDYASGNLTAVAPTYGKILAQKGLKGYVDATNTYGPRGLKVYNASSLLVALGANANKGPRAIWNFVEDTWTILCAGGSNARDLQLSYDGSQLWQADGRTAVEAWDVSSGDMVASFAEVDVEDPNHVQHNAEYAGDDEYCLFDNQEGTGADSRLLCFGVHWPDQVDVDDQYDVRALEVVRATGDVVYELKVVGAMCRSAADCDKGLTDRWTSYSAERFYAAPLVWNATCAGSTLRFTAADAFKRPNKYAATYDVVERPARRARSVAGDFELAAYWRDTAAAVDVSALTGPLTLTVTNAQGAATTVDVDACS